MTTAAATVTPGTPEAGYRAPWADWPEPEVFTSQLHELLVEADEPTGRLYLSRGGDRLARLGHHSLQELSTRISYPTDFIEKLTPPVQALVVNERVLAARDHELNLVVEPDPVYQGEGVLTALAPGWRGACSHKDVAQVAHDHLRSYPKDLFGQLELDRAEVLPSGLSLRFMTQLAQPITRAKGDALALGLEVRHRYGLELGVQLFTRRLVCLNGMTSDQAEFDWTHRTMGAPGDQLAWLRSGLDHAIESYGDLVARAQRMAEVRFSGDYRDALRERARLLRIPRRLWDQLVECFEEEPGDTEWHLLNAFTRFATHRADRDLGERLRRLAGEWVAGFDEVTARLPRPVAILVGAHLLEEAPEA